MEEVEIESIRRAVFEGKAIDVVPFLVKMLKEGKNDAITFFISLLQQMISKQESSLAKAAISLLQVIPREDLQTCLTTTAQNLSQQPKSMESLSLLLFIATLSISVENNEIAKENWKMATHCCLSLLEASSTSKEDIIFLRKCLGLYFIHRYPYAHHNSKIVIDCLPVVLIDVGNTWNLEMRDKLIINLFLYHVNTTSAQWKEFFMALSNFVVSSPWAGFSLFTGDIKAIDNIELHQSLMGYTEGPFMELCHKLRSILCVYHLYQHGEKLRKEKKMMFCCPTRNGLCNQKEPQGKRQRIDSSPALLHLSTARQYYSQESETFISGVRKEIESLALAESDMFAVAGEFKESNAFLNSLHLSSEYSDMVIKIRTSSNMICQGKHQEARRILLDLIEQLPLPGAPILPSSISKDVLKEDGEYEISFYTLSNPSLAVQCIRYLIGSYCDEELVGQAIVMTQYGWPYFQDKFQEIVASDCFQNGFKYARFNQFVAIVDILEEFLFQLSQPNEGLHIDISPIGVRQNLSNEMQKNLIISQVSKLHTAPFALDCIFHEFCTFTNHSQMMMSD